MGSPPSDGGQYSQQQSYNFSGRVMLTAVVILLVLTVVFVLIRLLLHQFLVRPAAGPRRRGGGIAAGFRRSLSSLGRSISGRHGLDAAALSALPVTAYRTKQAEGDSAGADCAVCLAELADGEKVRELPNCGHVFHVECVDAWLRSRTTCPLCRAEAAPKRAAQSSSATAPLPPALLGADGTLVVTVEGGLPDTRRDVHGSTSGTGQPGASSSQAVRAL